MRKLGILLGIIGMTIACEKPNDDVPTIPPVVIDNPNGTGTTTNTNNNTNTNKTIKSVSVVPNYAGKSTGADDLVFMIGDEEITATYIEGSESPGSFSISRRYNMNATIQGVTLIEAGIQFWLDGGEVKEVILTLWDDTIGQPKPIQIQGTTALGTFDQKINDTSFVGTYEGEGNMFENQTDIDISNPVSFSFEINVSIDSFNAANGEQVPEGTPLVNCNNNGEPTVVRSGEIIELGLLDCEIILEIGAVVFLTQSTQILGSGSIKIVQPANGGSSIDYVQFYVNDSELQDQVDELLVGQSGYAFN